MFRIAHISDLHIPPLPRLRMADLAGKRLLGWLSWHRKWRAEHRAEILEALLAQLRDLAPDHICVTGDLTFTTHPEEVDAAAAWLSALGDPQRISLIPGNHDAYVPGALDYAVSQWSPWMTGDDGSIGFPYLHRRGPVDIIGVSSAVPTLPSLSLGRVGRAQLQRLATMLDASADAGRPRILLIHHPPQDKATRAARALADRHELYRVLADQPVDLILHGHLHRPIRTVVQTPAGAIPVLGAASASTQGDRYTPAHYHLLEVTEPGGRPASISVRSSHYCPRRGAFILAASESLPTRPEIPAGADALQEGRA